MTKVTVELGADSYDILIGENLFGAAADFIDAKNFTKTLLVTDNVVYDKYGEKLMDIFKARGLEFDVVIIPAGELSKNLQCAEVLYTSAINSRLDRKSAIVALGGGVVGDLAGFVAATFLRGVNFIQIPTTLLAQVDSSVGGKTAVNHKLGKNLIGAFYQPKAVFIDLATLKTLPEREIKSGLAEVIKYGVICDENFFSYLEENVDNILGGDFDALAKIIRRSCEIKAEVVSRDEKESGLRRILNFGHTIAHAVEEETGYEKYLHGEAVSIGMLGAALISNKIFGVEINRLKNLLEKFGLQTHCENCSVDKLYSALFRDKKTVGGKINWVLMKKIGAVEISDDVPENVVRAALENITAQGG